MRRIPLPLRGGTGEAALGPPSRRRTGLGHRRGNPAPPASSARHGLPAARAERKLCASSAGSWNGGRTGGLGASRARRVGSPWRASRMSHMLGGLPVAPGSPAGAATVPRQEVPERIGLGRSSCCVRSSEPRAGGAVLARWRHPPPRGRPLTREPSAVVARMPGRAPRSACRPRCLEALRPQGCGPQGLHALRAGPQGQARSLARGSWCVAAAASPGRAEEGNLPRAIRGSGDRRLCSRAVLVAEVDERRSVHAFGHGSSPHALRTEGQPSGAVLR